MLISFSFGGFFPCRPFRFVFFITLLQVRRQRAAGVRRLFCLHVFRCTNSGLAKKKKKKRKKKWEKNDASKMCRHITLIWWTVVAKKIRLYLKFVKVFTSKYDYNVQ